MNKRKEGAIRCIYLLRKNPKNYNLLIKHLQHELFVKSLTLKEIGSSKEELRKLKARSEELKN